MTFFFAASRGGGGSQGLSPTSRRESALSEGWYSAGVMALVDQATASTRQSPIHVSLFILCWDSIECPPLHLVLLQNSGRIQHKSSFHTRLGAPSLSLQ